MQKRFGRKLPWASFIAALALQATLYGLCLVVSLFAPQVYGQSDWGPQLIPPHPSYYDDYDPEEAQAEAYRGGYAIPNRMTAAQYQRTQPLPSPANRRVRPTGRPVAFDSSLEPSEVIVPLRFLEDGESGPSAPPTTTKRTTKPRPSVENNFVDSNSQYNGGQYYVDEYGGQDSGYPASMGSGYRYGSNMAGNPAMDNCYAGPVMVKPFGTGYLDNLAVFAGVTSFKGEMDAGIGGNFGASEGINWSIPVTQGHSVSGQLGFRAVHSNLYGNGNELATRMYRNQYFATGGFFCRDLSYPIQGGLVFDWFQDEYYGKTEIEQIRYEISLRTFSNLEYGVLGGFGVNKKNNPILSARENDFRNTTGVNYQLRAENYYLGFFRKHFGNGNMGEIRAGATDNGDVIVSGFGELPLNDILTLNGGYTILFPKEGRNQGGGRRETWDISVGLTFYFRGGAYSKPCNPCRPMFNVASNGSFMNRFRAN